MTGQMTMRGARAPVTWCGHSIGGKSFALWYMATSMYPILRED